MAVPNVGDMIEPLPGNPIAGRGTAEVMDVHPREGSHVLCVRFPNWCHHCWGPTHDCEPHDEDLTCDLIPIEEFDV